MSKELCFRITVKFIFFSRFLQRFWLVTWITAVNSFPNSVSQIPVPRSLNNIMNLRINNRSILFKNWTCGTQGQQHRGVSEHHNTYYHPSPAHLKMQWFIAFFFLFLFFLLLTNCFSAFEMENWNWNGKLKFSTHFPHSTFSTPLIFHIPHSSISTEPSDINLARLNWAENQPFSFDSHVAFIERRKVVIQLIYCITFSCPKKHNYRKIGLT